MFNNQIGILFGRTHLMGMISLLVPIVAMDRVHMGMRMSMLVTVGMGVDNITM